MLPMLPMLPKFGIQGTCMPITHVVVDTTAAGSGPVTSCILYNVILIVWPESVKDR